MISCAAVLIVVVAVLFGLVINGEQLRGVAVDFKSLTAQGLGTSIPYYSRT